MADRALRLAHVRLVVTARDAGCKLFADAGVAFEAELPYLRAFQHLRIGRSMGCVARSTSLEFDRPVFEHERPLLVRMALDARGIRTDSELCLLLLEPAVRVVAIAARHCPLEDLVVKRLAELCLHFRVAADTEIRLTALEHRHFRNAGLLYRGIGDERLGTGL